MALRLLAARSFFGGDMKHSSTCALAFASTAILSACGGGGDNGAGPQPSSDVAYFTGKNDSMAKRISDAKSLEEATTFEAKTVGMNHTWDDENTVHELTASEDATFRIFRTSADAVPTFVVTQNGETTTFGPEHAPENENYRVVIPGDDNDIWLWTWAGYPRDHANGFDWGDWTEEGRYNPLNRKYHIPVGMYRRGDPTDQRRYAVIGLETAPGDMPTHDVRALYDGNVRMDVYLKDGVGIESDDRTRYDADITLTADFSEGTIGGVMDNWESRDDDDDLSAVSYMLTPASITGNGYTTSMAASPSCTGCAEVVDSTIAGKFYGPFADETGGTIQAEFRDGGTESVGIGIFYTSRD